jgi:hypothetical protein
MTIAMTTAPTRIGRARYTSTSTDIYMTFTPVKTDKKCAIVNGMTSSVMKIAVESTSVPSSQTDLKARWEKIMSFAGAWEGDEDALTVEGLEELRHAAWGNRLDAFDDIDAEESNP